MSGAARSKAVTRFGETRIEDRRQDLNDGLLDQAVQHVWDAELPLAAVGFVDRHASHRPVGRLNLWSPHVRSRECAGPLAGRGSLTSSRSKALPCSSSFGPSRLDWTSSGGTTTSADSCTAHGGFRRCVPGVRASPPCGSDAWPWPSCARLPG